MIFYSMVNLQSLFTQLCIYIKNGTLACKFNIFSIIASDVFQNNMYNINDFQSVQLMKIIFVIIYIANTIPTYTTTLKCWMWEWD